MPGVRLPRNSKGRFMKRSYSRKRRRANRAGVVFSGQRKWGSKYKGKKVPVYRPRIKLLGRRSAKRAKKWIGRLRARSARASLAQRWRMSALRTPGRAYYNNPGGKRRRRRRRARVAMNPAPVRRRRRRARRARIAMNPPRRRRSRRRRARRSANPFRRRARRSRNPRARRRARRFRNPFGISLPKLPGPFDLGKTVESLIDASFVGAGAWLASWIPQQVVSFAPAYSWLNQGYYGVALSAASTSVASMLSKKFVSDRMGKMVMIGGGLTTLFRLLTQLAPAQAIEAVPADIKSQIFFMGAAAAGAKGVTGYGDSGFFSPAQIVAGERRGVNDWVQVGRLPGPAMNDWVNMGATAPLSTGNESF